jgi:hypothetical protein
MGVFGKQKRGTSPILLKPIPTVKGKKLEPTPMKDKKKK